VHGQVSDRKRQVGLKYFTFCASNAIDVFMLAKADLIPASDRSRGFETVYFCERNAAEYEKTISLVGQNGFLGKFESLVLFEEDNDTRQFGLDDNPPQHIRRKLQDKEQHERFVKSFPFDVINLDMNGVFFPPKAGTISPMLEITRRILDWQQARDATDGHKSREFTLLLTSHVSAADANTDAINQLVQRMSLNRDESEEFRTAYQKRFGEVEPEELAEENFPDFFAAALPKVLVRDALDRGWEPEYRGIFLYERVVPSGERRYHMMSSVTHFKRARLPECIDNLVDTAFGQNVESYRDITTQVLEHEFCYCDDALQDTDVNVEVKQHLDAVRKYRDDFIASAES